MEKSREKMGTKKRLNRQVVMVLAELQTVQLVQPWQSRITSKPKKIKILSLSVKAWNSTWCVVLIWNAQNNLRQGSLLTTPSSSTFATTNKNVLNAQFVVYFTFSKMPTEFKKKIGEKNIRERYKYQRLSEDWEANINKYFSFACKNSFAGRAVFHSIKIALCLIKCRWS